MLIWEGPERYLTTAGGKEWLKVQFEDPHPEELELTIEDCKLNIYGCRFALPFL